MRIVLTTLLALGLNALGAPAHALDVDREKPTMLHRVLWVDFAKANPGIHVRSMERDGTDVRNAYDWPRGFTLELSLDPMGRKVAFSPCCRSALPLLVVAPVLGGKPLEPLKKGKRIDVVSAIAWSPNGKRIVFEGISGPTGSRVPTIWTVRPNGKGLRRILDLPPLDPDGPNQSVSLGWSAEGILYSYGGSLRRVQSGHSVLVMKDVGAFRMSGDGNRLVMHRAKGGEHGAIWMSDPDGTHRRKLLVQGEPQNGTEYYLISPSYDATEMLATRRGPAYEEQLVTWRVSEGVGSAAPLELPDEYPFAATWN